MPKAHRNNDSRACGAKTIVEQQSTVFVNGKRWAVKGDKNDHGDGQLIDTTGHTVFCEGKQVIVKGDKAEIDGELHEGDEDAAQGSSGDVFAYGN